jgi:DNA-binding transcriptional regulator YdaS (Cro superfamily)
MAYSAPLQAVLDEAGGPTALAAALGISPSAVTQWTDVPARHLLRVAAITKIRVEKIRPDLVPVEGKDSVAAADAA